MAKGGKAGGIDLVYVGQAALASAPFDLKIARNGFEENQALIQPKRWVAQLRRIVFSFVFGARGPVSKLHSAALSDDILSMCFFVTFLVTLSFKFKCNVRIVASWINIHETFAHINPQIKK